MIPGGRRSGKTTGGMTHAADQGLTRKDIKMLWVDTTQGNIEKYVSEILLPMLPKGSYSWNRQQKVLRFVTGSVMHFGSAERPENLEGFGYQIIYLNEAGIILKGQSGERLWHNTLRPMIIEEKDGQKCQVFFIGTPKGKGLFQEFAERAVSSDPDWRCFNLSTYDNPLLPREEIDLLVKESPGKIARQEIFGEFLDEDDEESVISVASVHEALGRIFVLDPLYAVIWGVDVARGKHDRSVLVQRRWNRLAAQTITWLEKDSIQLAGELQEEFERLKPEQRPTEILIDEIGVGSGVVDQTRKLGLPVRGINVSRKSRFEKKFLQLKDELWWKARAWIETGSLCNEIELGKELSKPVVDRKILETKGLFKVESKDKMESRLGSTEGRSPDLADAFVLTFAAGIERLPDRAGASDYNRIKRGFETPYTFMGS